MFNNREIATAVWLTIVAIWTLTKPDFRTSITCVFRAFLNWKIQACVAAMILYTAALIGILYAIGFWQFPMMKDTVLWLLTAFAMVLRFSTSRDNDNIVREVFAECLKLTIFLEFLIGTYVMSLPAELVFVPFVTFIVLVDAFAKLNAEHAFVANFTSCSLAIIGLVILGFAASRAVGDLRSLGTMNTVRSIAFPPLMSIAFIPFIYPLVVIAAYESIFVRLTVGRDKGPDVVRYAKRRILLHCGLSVRRLHAFAKRPPLDIMQVESNADVDRLFAAQQNENG